MDDFMRAQQAMNQAQEMRQQAQEAIHNATEAQVEAKESKNLYDAAFAELSKENFNASELSNTVKLITSIGGDLNLVGFGMMDPNEVVVADGSISDSIGQIQSRFIIISREVKSEDSNLSEVCNELATTLNNFMVRLDTTCNQIINALSQYAQETVANEQGANQSINDINSELDNIKSALNNLN